MPPGEAEQYRGRLLDAGLLVATGERGLYGRSGLFEGIVAGIERVAGAAGRPDQPEVRRFAPVIPIDVLVRAGYPRSFPDLVGSISTFTGGDADHARLLGRLDAGEEWTDELVPAGTAMCAAACQPLYPTISGTLPEGGRHFDVYGWVFRHEPSDDPARQQAFRQYEHIFVGEPAGAEAHRDKWRERAAATLAGLGLEIEVVVANDPFFGRAGRLLARSQQEAELKFEVVAPTGPESPATAITSANWHQDHFGHQFDIADAGGSPAHSACVGFGVERIALALLWAHGLDVGAWPDAVRDQLWP